MKIVIDIPNDRDAEEVVKYITEMGGVDWDMGYLGPTAFVLSAHKMGEAAPQRPKAYATTLHSSECVTAHFKNGHTFITPESPLCNCIVGVDNR